MKDKYFSHDFGARNDPKMQKLMMKLGHAGKGVYWDIVEMLYEEGGYLQLSEIEVFAYTLRYELDSLIYLIKESGLFCFDDVNFWSESVLRRLNKINEKSEIARKKIAKRWNKSGNTEKSKNDTDEILQYNNSNTDVIEQNEVSNTIKVKESKVKENKIKEIKESGCINAHTHTHEEKFLKPTFDEVKEFFVSLKYMNGEALKFYSYYEANGWMKGQTPIVDWKAAVVSWTTKSKLQRQYH